MVGQIMSIKQIECKDCNSTEMFEHPKDAYEAGWQWLDIVEGEDVVNGWRCPKCVAGWDVIVNEHPEVLQ